MNQFNVIQANSTHIELVAPLFNSYRQFYGQTADLIQVRNFLYERLVNEDSVVFIAVTQYNPFECLGFTQLYPSFSSVAMQRTWILNDLFVLSNFRNQGVGIALLNAAKDFAIRTKVKRLTLATAIDNYPAQKLYEKAGYIKDKAFYHYQLDISIPGSNEFHS
ncbi:GNAT family N-acetyltransferase [Gloeocapsopsis crepidinum LEGE 06123]|uniref:GNAT family N-acetyltransferase n=1 Tax=Gloeocapsopsis crepidinum LEGE 06123 TaxID=588587 RepID=A0ABR9UMZ1_9CHRO|nr:GNAT family N-acetyltransferase [Gloeocapsopsis crepidinum]MBE9189645.1 GNAT family N-acetyltransferase [Gloeocapsopsis crepidinum LEGE 06123]